MRRLISLIAALALAASLSVCVSAETANVTYSGNAGKFIFTPGSDLSVTDLFPNFKGVMPGDSLEQQITVKNKASNKVKVKIYLRSLGADAESALFLSQLQLRVSKSAENTMGYMFDAGANEDAQLSDWVLLGTLYSGGEVTLDVALDVPVTLGNEFQDQIGRLTWMFKVEEYPIEDSDPKPPPTGDTTELLPAFALMAVSAAVFVLVIIFFRKKKQADNT